MGQICCLQRSSTSEKKLNKNIKRKSNLCECSTVSFEANSLINTIKQVENLKKEQKHKQKSDKVKGSRSVQGGKSNQVNEKTNTKEQTEEDGNQQTNKFRKEKTQRELVMDPLEKEKISPSSYGQSGKKKQQHHNQVEEQINNPYLLKINSRQSFKSKKQKLVSPSNGDYENNSEKKDVEEENINSVQDDSPSKTIISSQVQIEEENINSVQDDSPSKTIISSQVQIEEENINSLYGKSSVQIVHQAIVHQKENHNSKKKRSSPMAYKKKQKTNRNNSKLSFSFSQRQLHLTLRKLMIRHQQSIIEKVSKRFENQIHLLIAEIKNLYKPNDHIQRYNWNLLFNGFSNVFEDNMRNNIISKQQGFKFFKRSNDIETVQILSYLENASRSNDIDPGTQQTSNLKDCLNQIIKYYQLPLRSLIDHKNEQSEQSRNIFERSRNMQQQERQEIIEGNQDEGLNGILDSLGRDNKLGNQQSQNRQVQHPQLNHQKQMPIDHSNQSQHSIHQTEMQIQNRQPLDKDLYFPTDKDQKDQLQHLSTSQEQRKMQDNNYFERQKEEGQKSIQVQNTSSFLNPNSEDQESKQQHQKISLSDIYNSKCQITPNRNIAQNEIGKLQQLQQAASQYIEESIVRLFQGRYEWVTSFRKNIYKYLSIQRAALLIDLCPYCYRNQMYESQYHDLSQYDDYSIECRREMLNRSCPNVEQIPTSNDFMRTHNTRRPVIYPPMPKSGNHGNDNDSLKQYGSNNSSIIDQLNEIHLKGSQFFDYSIQKKSNT